MGLGTQRRRQKALKDVWAKVRDRLRSLHKLYNVHGDVRDVNVLVRNAAVAKTEPDVLLVGWEWTGTQKLLVLSATYPLADEYYGHQAFGRRLSR